MAQTKITNLINPQVMGDMISATLPAMIKFSPLATIDTTLVGQPGNTITVPTYAYIGDAADIAEGVAIDPVLLTATSATVTVKKAGKGIELTDEAVLSGYGDPVGEGNNQLGLSIAAKVDKDCLASLLTSTLTYDGSAAVIGYTPIVNAVDVFGEEDMEPKVIFVNPKQVTQLRLDADFKDINKYPLQTVMTGVIGEICGCQVVPSKNVVLESTFYRCPIVKAGALTIYMKKAVEVEDGRDILKKTTVITADQHYATSLSNTSKVVVAKFKNV